MQVPEMDLKEAGDGRELLHKLLEILGAEDQIVLRLMYLEEKSVREVQDVTGWNAALIKVRAFRAKRKLRKALEALEGGAQKSSRVV